MEQDASVIKTKIKSRRGGWAKAGPGRPKGRLNKSTVEIKELAGQLLSGEKYLRNLQHRLERGDAGPIEPLLYYYRYGKPVDSVIVPMQQVVINNGVKAESEDPYSQVSVVFQSLLANGILPDELLRGLNGHEDAILIGSNGGNGKEP